MMSSVLKKTLVLVLIRAGICIAATEQECIPLNQYAINNASLDALTGGGHVRNDAPAYFEIPSGYVSGEVLFCLTNLTVPTTVGGRPCDQLNQCYLAVGHRHGPKERGVSKASYNCLCSGSTINAFDPSIEASADICGLSKDEDSWEVVCRDAAANDIELALSPQASSSAYISICPENAALCGVCQPGGGNHPSFVVGVQWVSNVQEQCVHNPFPDFTDSCSGLTTSSIVGIAVGAALLLGSVGGILYCFCSARKRTKNVDVTDDVWERHPWFKGSDMEKQRPPVEEISITTDSSPGFD